MDTIHSERAITMIKRISITIIKPITPTILLSNYKVAKLG
jgi:hypothetical protein